MLLVNCRCIHFLCQPELAGETLSNRIKDVLFSLKNRTSFAFYQLCGPGRFIRDKQGLKTIIEHMDGPDAG